MADLQNQEYKLYKEIQVKFREVVDPLPLSDYLFERNCLTEDDVDRIQTKESQGSRSRAAGELLDRLRRRPNWMHNLLEACRHPELGLDHLYKHISDKMTKLEIRITILCKDGHNCAGVPVSGFDAGGETVTQQEQDTQMGIKEFLEEFKSRVDPGDFLQYLIRLKEDDEEAVKCKEKQNGRLAAAEELVFRLMRNYKHWKDDLQEALSYNGSGLEDLGKKLSDIEIDEGSLREILENLQSQPDISTEELKKRINVVLHEYLCKQILAAKRPDELQQTRQLIERIDAVFVEPKKGSLILILAVNSIDTLEAIKGLFLGGVLAEVIKKDLLSEKRRHHILETARKNGAKDGDIENGFFDNLEFDVEICPSNFQFCQLNLKAIKDKSIPSSPFQSAADFEYARKSRVLKRSYGKSISEDRNTGIPDDETIHDKIDLPLPSVISRLLEDPFLQSRYRKIGALFSGPVDKCCHLFVQWLFDELGKFVSNHKYGEELSTLGLWLGSTFRFSSVEKQERILFEVRDQYENIYPYITKYMSRKIKPYIASTNMGNFPVLYVEAWEEIVKGGIFEFSENHQRYRFQSQVLEQYFIFKSDESSAISFVGYLPVFQLAENPQGLTKPLIEFNGDSKVKMEYLCLHYLVMKHRDSIHRLDALKVLVPGDKIFVVSLQEESFDAQIDILKVLIQEEMIDAFDIVIGPADKERWDLSVQPIKKSLIVREIRSLMNVARLLSFLGTVQIDVDAKVDRLANICFKIPRKSSISFTGHLGLKFSRASLKSPEDIEALYAGLQLIPNLHQLDLSGTSYLEPIAYRRILKACRLSKLSSLVLNDTILMNKEDPQRIGLQYLPHLKRLEMEGCDLGDAGIHAMSPDLKEAGQLTEISVARNKITSSGILELSGLLMEKENLRSVKVHENDVGYEGAVSLAILFKNLPFLEVINLCDCKGITDKGFELIIESLKGKNLKKMNVRNCGFSRRISEKYFNLLKNMPNFQHLDYGCNPVISSNFGLVSISPNYDLLLEMLSCNKHSWNLLNLWKCNIGLTDVFATSNRLGHMSTLTDLCLQENQLNDRDGACIGECMETSWHSLRNLNLRQNNIGDFGATKLFKGVKKNPKLKTFYLDRNQISDGELITEMAMYFVGNVYMDEMDVSYNEVPETETRRFLGDTPANIVPCNGYTEISINNRIMRL